MCVCKTTIASGLTITYNTKRPPVTQAMRDLIANIPPASQPVKTEPVAKSLGTTNTGANTGPTEIEETEELRGQINIHLNEKCRDYHLSGHRTNGKGGWTARNRGKKPEYKNKTGPRVAAMLPSIVVDANI